MIYFGLALFCTGIFIVQFIVSMIFGELDTDIDFDGDGSADFDVSSLISFKGLIHFGIGFSWSMWFSRGDNQFVAALTSIGVGLVFMIILAGVYWLALKLKKDIKPETGNDLVGRGCEVYYRGTGENEWMIFTEINGSSRVISAVSESGQTYMPGESTIILSYKEGHYIIP